MQTFITHFPGRSFGLILLFPLIISSLYGQNLTKEMDAGDSPVKRYQWEMMRTANPETHTIPDNIRTNELEFAKKIPAALPHRDMLSKNDKLTSTDVTMEFAAIGPYNVGGRTLTFAQDITKPNIMLVGGATGGVWRSVDKGNTWTKTLPANEFQHVSCIVQDKRPGKTNIWYMGTGEVLSTTERRTSTNFRTILTGTGIYKSIDGGVTWKVLPSTQVNTLKPNVLATSFQGVWDIAINPVNSASDELYAACYGGIMRSLDGGDSWINVLGDSAMPCFNSTIVITPGGIMYSALSAGEFGEKTKSYGVFRSADGTNWTNITPTGFADSLRRYRLAYAPSNPNILYVLAERPRRYSDIYTDIYNEKYTFWKYKYVQGNGANSGGVWQQRDSFFSMSQTNEFSADKTFAALSGYCLALAVKPDDENAVLIAGSNLYYSTNGFADTTKVKHLGGYPYIVAPPTFMHPDVHNLVFDNQDPNKLYSANDGGLDMLTTINGADISSWVTLNNGFTCTQYYGIALDHQAPGDKRVLGGLQDNSTFLGYQLSPDSKWQQITGGDGCIPAIQHKDNILITTAQGGYVAATLLDLNRQYYLSPNENAGDVPKLFVTNPFLDPWDENNLYIPAGNKLFTVADLHRLTDTNSGYSFPWTAVPMDNGVIPQNHFITAIGASTELTKVLFVGTHLGKLYTVEIGSSGGAVSNISSPSFPANSFISSIAVDSKNPDNILVAFSNYSVQSLFSTIDGGNSWTPVAGNLEMSPDGSGWGPSFRCVKILHKGESTIYAVGTSTGLYTTETLNGTKTEWTQQGVTTIGNLTVEAMDYRESDGQLIIGTHGGGAFASTVMVGVETQTAVQEFFLEQNYPNPVSSTTTIYFSVDKQSDTKMTLADAAGKTVRTLVDENLPAGLHHVSLTDELLSTLSSGVYYYRLRVGNKESTKMMTVVK